MWIVYSLIRGNLIEIYKLKKDADKRAGTRRLNPMFGVIHSSACTLSYEYPYGKVVVPLPVNEKILIHGSGQPTFVGLGMAGQTNGK